MLAAWMLCAFLAGANGADLALPAPMAGPVRVAELTAPNPVSAATLADAGITTLFIDAAAAERGQISAVVKAVQHRTVAVVGRFDDAKDVSLKPKLDEGLSGAVLQKSESLKDVARFLKRLYLPPLGERPVGPSDVTGYLSHARDFIDKNNASFHGGISIATPRAAANIRRLLKAKALGLRFIEIGAGLTPEAAADVAAAAREAGVAVIDAVHSDGRAVDEAFARYGDLPRDVSKDADSLELGFLMSPDPVMARLLSARSRGLWIDAEDGQFSLAAVREMLAAKAPGKPALVRAVEWNDPNIAEYIRAGAAGVVAPQVSYAWQARAFVAAVKKADPRALAVVMIENRRGLARAEEISAVPGLDGVFVGPNDLALSLGVAQDGPAFAAAQNRIEAAARAAGVFLGGLSRRLSQTYAMRERGYRLVTTVSDQGALTAYFRR